MLASEVHDVLARHMLADGFPLVVDLERSRGGRIVDARNGDDYVDFFTSFSTTPLGLNHPGMDDAAFREELLSTAVNKLANSDLYTEPMARFVEAFSRTLPEEFQSHTFYIEGGALAVENALKAAFDWKTRKNLARGSEVPGDQIVHFRHAFHGRSGYTMSLTNTDPTKVRYFPKFDWPRVDTPRLTFPRTAESDRRVIESERQALSEIERAFDERGDRIAGIIIEPIQGEGGDNHFRGDFLRALREIADRRQALLIFDEVQTGFATTGSWWCFEHFDVPPDIFAFGKKTQVCGMAASHRLDEVDSVFEVSSRINSTWGGNLVDMVRCRRIIEIIEEEGLLENAAKVGGDLLAAIQATVADQPELLSNPRGRGMFVAFDLPGGEERDALLEGCYRQRLLALPSGERSIRFRPPVSLSSAEAAEGIDRLHRALRSCEPAGAVVGRRKSRSK